MICVESGDDVSVLMAAHLMTTHFWPSRHSSLRPLMPVAPIAVAIRCAVS